MYVTALNVQQVDLTHCLDGGNWKIALAEVNYSARWYNISRDLRNHRLSVEGEKHTIPDGYYNVCSLDEALKPHGISAQLHTPTGYIRIITGDKKAVLSPRLAKTLGFPAPLEPTKKSHLATRPHRLAIHRELFIHLSELNCSENSVNGLPSTLLRAVPVGNESCGSGRVWAPSVREYKRLKCGPLSHLSIEVRGESGETLPFDYLRMKFYMESNKAC